MEDGLKTSIPRGFCIPMFGDTRGYHYIPSMSPVSALRFLHANHREAGNNAALVDTYYFLEALVVEDDHYE